MQIILYLLFLIIWIILSAKILGYLIYKSRENIQEAFKAYKELKEAEQELKKYIRKKSI